MRSDCGCHARISELESENATLRAQLATEVHADELPSGGSADGTPSAMLTLRTLARDARLLQAAFDMTPPDRMTPVFYAHAFNEYDLLIRDLIELLADAPNVGI